MRTDIFDPIDTLFQLQRLQIPGLPGQIAHGLRDFPHECPGLYGWQTLWQVAIEFGGSAGFGLGFLKYLRKAGVGIFDGDIQPSMGPVDDFLSQKTQSVSWHGERVGVPGK